MASAAAAAARRARAIDRINQAATQAAGTFVLNVAPPPPTKDPEGKTSSLLEYAADVLEAINAQAPAPPEAVEATATPRRSKATL